MFKMKGTDVSMVQEKRNKALSQIMSADYASARSTLEEIISFDSENGDAWFLLGAVNGYLNDFPKVIECSEKAIACKFNMPDAYFNKGLAERALKKYGDAAKSFREVLKLNPRYINASREFRSAMHEASAGQLSMCHIKGGVAVSVPSSLELLARFVLLEQEDWFEQEIGFVRKMIEPGDIALDIGANHGVYAMTMARLCQPNGSVYAFEPVAETASHLRRSASFNNLDNVHVIQSAISNRVGEIDMYLADNSELNSLTRADGHGKVERVLVTTLDEEISRFEGKEIAFVKIDAEGEEARIIEAGQLFFRNFDPLVMLEVRHGDITNTSILNELQEYGYSTYRLVPGLGVLAPYALNVAQETSQLNLFCCKPSASDRLHMKGLLVQQAKPPVPECHTPGEFWLQYVPRLGFAASFAAAWGRIDIGGNKGGAADYLSALDMYAVAHSSGLSADVRYLALKKALKLLNQAISKRKSIARQLSRVRMVAELGHQKIAIAELNEICESLAGQDMDQIAEPFIPPFARFDNIVCMPEKRHDWLVCCVYELLEFVGKYTSYPCSFEALSLLEEIRARGFSSCATERRYQLLRLREGLGINRDGWHARLLDERTCLNHAFWSEEISMN